MDNIRREIKQVRGMLDAREGTFLNRLADKIVREENEKSVLCEIGSYCGRSTIFIARALVENNAGMLYAIDWHRGNPSMPGFGTKDYESTFTEYLRNLERFGVKDRVKTIQKRSEDAVNDVPDRIHFLWIDGLHSYDGVEKDFKNYESKVVGGGYLLFHDACWTSWTDPFRLIKNEVLRNQNYNLYAMIGNTMIFRKEPNTLNPFKEKILCALCEFVSGENRAFHQKAVSFLLFRLTTYSTVLFHNWRKN